MPVIDLKLDGEGAWSDMDIQKIRKAVGSIGIAGLANGMTSGLPSVAFRLNLEDGTFVFAETSLRLFLNAADALKAYYGDPR